MKYPDEFVNYLLLYTTSIHKLNRPNRIKMSLRSRHSCSWLTVGACHPPLGTSQKPFINDWLQSTSRLGGPLRDQIFDSDNNHRNGGGKEKRTATDMIKIKTTNRINKADSPYVRKCKKVTLRSGESLFYEIRRRSVGSVIVIIDYYR